MNESPHGVAADEAQQPEGEENDGDRVEHGIDCLVMSVELADWFGIKNGGQEST